MSSVSEQYKQVSSHLDAIQSKISKNEERIAEIQSKSSTEISERIANLEATLEKVDDYILRLRGIQERAKHNISSTNVPTIETYEGYKVNLNRLRYWMQRIDPNSDDDPYALQVFCVAKCDEMFLEQKKVEFTEKLHQLQHDLSHGLSSEVNRIRSEIKELEDEINQYIDNGMTEFYRSVISENERFRFHSQLFSNRSSVVDTVAFGAYEAPLHVPRSARGKLSLLLKENYSETTGRVRIPFEIDTSREFILNIRCASNKRNALDKAIQNFALQLIDGFPAGMQKIYCIDAARMSSVGLTPLKAMEDTFALAKIPKNEGEITATLQNLVSSMSDVDEDLENFDSVIEYNENLRNRSVNAGEKENNPDSNVISRSIIILYGWPSSFNHEDVELINKLLRNYERYGFSFIIVRYGNTEEKEEKKDIPEYAYDNSIRITISSKDTLIAFEDNQPQRFSLYSFENAAVPDEYIRTLREQNVSKGMLGNVYTDRIDLTTIPDYNRGSKKISVPYAVDSKDELQTLSFTNENFAMYLMGASGSGKSTLLHTIITGILKNYHPDDVELWLADFKMAEFSQYIDPIPPHVRYILLDESRELVFDLIDKLTEKMMERQKYFMRHRDKKNVEMVSPSEKFMPIIFVILDEFSIMSQAVAEAESYRLKLQNLLTKGRALGIKFIFSSQEFSKGVIGLTTTAKDQIQMRIAMKNTYEEIEITLGLNGNEKTEQVKNWMSALPPHHTLIKYREGYENKVERFKTLYFKGDDNNGGEYAAQAAFIRAINEKYKPVQEYNPEIINQYVDKKPVVIDGNSYIPFSECEKELDSDGREKMISFGSPRLMTSHKFIEVTDETRENILLLARSNETDFTASIILSAIKLWIAQKGKAEIWAYGRNPLYLKYRDVFKSAGAELIVGEDDVCNKIKESKKEIQQKKLLDKLIVLIGVERICCDFSFFEASGNNGFAVQKRNELADIAAPKTTAEAIITKYKQRWIVETQNITDEEEKKSITIRLKKEREEELKKLESNVQSDDSEKTNISTRKSSGAYNAGNDFNYILSQGSRYGMHFFLYLSDYSELKEIGLKKELFRHIMTFRVSGEESSTLFGKTKLASGLPEHICQYVNSSDVFSFRPYLHKGIEWDGWSIDEDGTVLSPFMLED